MPIQTRYTLTTRLLAPIDQARPVVEAALRREGFGVLTEIDVQATLKTRLGIEGEPYLILGACNPPLAHRALTADPSVGALLPCNVVLRADGAGTIVEAMDPAAVMSLVDDRELAAVAAEARARLARALDALEV